MAPHPSTLAWKIPWSEEPGRLQSMGSLRVGHDWVTSLSLSTFMHWRRQWHPTPVLLPGESQGQQSLVGCRLWSHTELDRTEATWHTRSRELLGTLLVTSFRFFIIISHLLLLLLSHFSRVRLCATPWTAAYKASPSMRFSRQEHWRRPLPSPMHESGKWKWSRSVMSDS